MDKNTKKDPLTVRNLNLSIEGRPILKDINLVFPENKITCIVGPSGCGKSTLLKALNRLIDNVDGVKIDGQIMIGDQNIIGAKYSDLIELRRRIGLVPQRPCPLPMSIFDNVAYGCRIHGMHPKKKELAEVVEKYLTEVGLWDEVKDRLQSSATRLSIGQQQRLCLARSLAVEPDFILADEATSALDVTIQKQVVEEMLLMRKEYGTAMIIVTHNIGVVEKMADKVLVLKNGEVREYGKTAQVLTAPTDPYTKELMRSVLRLKRAGTGNGGR